MPNLNPGDLVELDGLLAVVVGIAGDANVPEDHIAVWFGKPDCVRISEGGAGGQSPEIWTVPIELVKSTATATWDH